MIATPVVLHVGFSKTATTSLQNHVFAHLAGVANLGKPFEESSRAPLYRAITHLTFAEEMRYEARATAQAFEAALAGASGTVLISSEGMTYGRHNDPALVARRLRALFTSARIVFTIREQVSWVMSLYLDDCARQVFTRPMPSFATWMGWEGRKRNRNAVDMSNFDTTIRCYEALFGRENIHVLPYELLLRDRAAFGAAFAAAMGVEPGRLLERLASLPRSNVALSARAYRFGLVNYYFVPHVLRRLFSPGWLRRMILAGEAAKPAMPERYVRLIHERVGEGNRRLSDGYGVPLSRYGYHCASKA